MVRVVRGPRTDFHGKSCLVTGAASGIGRATALAVARRGGRLVLTDVQAERLGEAVDEIRRAGGIVLEAAPADVTSYEAVTELADRVHAAHGSLDIVMNVAGTSLWGPIERLENEHWRKMVEVDLMGPIHVMEAFVPPMVAAGRGGHLVNVSSAAGLLGLPWHAAYSAAKFGLRGVSEVLRFDLRLHGIAVTLVCPGAVATPLVDTLEIVGVDRQHPAARRMAEEFVRRAHTPAQVAEDIVRGVERGKYLVFTSRDIRVAFFLQRVFPPAYELAMRALNRRFVRVAEKASV
jgi:NAD(P)-dependent dehydrogenase (short-subunit alcohol dehydrogenase family)